MLHIQSAAPIVTGALAAEEEVRSQSSRAASYAVRVTTSKVEPRYIKGEFIVLEPTQDAIPGDWVGVAVGAGLGHIGRVLSWDDEDVVIEQLNPPTQLMINRAEIEASYIITGTFCDHPYMTAAISMHAVGGAS